MIDKQLTRSLLDISDQCVQGKGSTKDIIEILNNIVNFYQKKPNVKKELNSDLKDPITLNEYNSSLFRVSWNDDELIQIHSEKTLKDEYQKTNLFDDNLSWIGYPNNIFNANDYQRSFKTLNDVIYFLNDDDCTFYKL